MAETWPTGVPYKADNQSFRITNPFRRPHRTPFEDGPHRAQRSTTKNIATIGFTLIPMTLEEYRAFALWVRDTLVDGTLPFTMNVWTGTGDKYAARTCTMAEDYTMSPIGADNASVSLVLDVEDYTAEAAPLPVSAGSFFGARYFG